MEDEALFDELYDVLIGLRSSLDMRFRIARPMPPKIAAAFKSALLTIESIRLDAMNLRRRAGKEMSPDAIPTLRSGFQSIMDDPEVMREIADVRFRGRNQRDRSVAIFNVGDLSVAEAIALAMDRIDAIYSESSQEIEGTVALRRLVPEQKLAPVMFDIVDGRLTVARQPGSGEPEDKENIDRAKETLLEKGGSIIDSLERSNCDRRLLDSLRELQGALCQQDNIIELALLNIGVERICKGAAAEIPEAILGAIEGHTAGIGMYVAQFPEWRRFSENAASIDLSANDIGKIDSSIEAIIDSLSENPDMAELEVPKTLRALRSLISDPALASKRAAFAVLRTIENMVARIYKFGADFIDKTATKTVDSGSSIASKVIVAGLMTLALAATSNLGPVAGKVAETAWMKTAAQIVKKQVGALTN